MREFAPSSSSSSCSSFPPAHCAYRVVAAALICAALSISALQIHKYAKGRTTLTYTAEEGGSMPLPAISFCPGFKSGKAEKSIWSRAYWRERKYLNTTFPTDEEELRRMWREITFDWEEVVARVDITELEETYKWSNDSARCFVVVELDTWSGRCYTMKNECPLGNEVMNYKLVFDLTRVHKRAMNLFFHHHPEDAMMGLNDNYWLLSSAETKVFSGERIDLVLAKQKRITKAGRGGGGGGGGEQTAGEYFECIRRFMGFVYSRISDWTNGTAFCSSPIYNSFFNYIPGSKSDLRPCADWESYRRSHSYQDTVLYWREFTDDPDDQANSRFRCAPPSKHVNYQVRKKEVTPSVALLRDESNVDATKIFLYYKDNHEVLVETEYVLMDLGGLLSGIGGIVGALLGWSALDVAAKVCKACQSRKERRSVATNTTQGNNNKSPT